MGELAVCADKVEVVLHGVDLQLLQRTPDQWAAKSQMDLVRPTQLSVGHPIPRKGHEVAIWGLRLLPQAHLPIVGKGPLEADLIKQAEDMREAKRVRFMGQVSQPELAALKAAVDGRVLRSNREGIANVLLEAMSYGTAAVTTPVWGTPELLDAAPGCVLAADGRPEAVAAGIRRLLSATVGGTALRCYAERYTWPATARRHHATLRAAIVLYRASLPASGARA